MRLHALITISFGLVCALAFAIGPMVRSTPSVEARVVTEDCTGSAAVCVDWDSMAHWVDTEVLPLPEGPQVPLSVLRSQGGGGWSSFRAPFPPVPAWNPPGPKRVGLQAGHWQFADSPDELAELRSNPGASGGGKAEWEVTLDIAQRAAATLRGAGVEVDLLPTTIPIRYRAQAFVAIHADGDAAGALSGYKVGRSFFTATPEADDMLVNDLNEAYGPATGLVREDAQVSLRMKGYYAFNARRYQHAVAPGVAQAIIETGFMSSEGDRRVIIGDPDRAAAGIAEGVLRFLKQMDAPNMQ